MLYDREQWPREEFVAPTRTSIRTKNQLKKTRVFEEVFGTNGGPNGQVPKIMF